MERDSGSVTAAPHERRSARGPIARRRTPLPRPLREPYEGRYGLLRRDAVQEEPRLVRKMILAGTGPAGGDGIDKVTRITYLDIARGLLTRRDPKEYLFFT